MKKSKKVLSIILALVMVFSSLSAAVVAFAAEDDLYTDVITEERVNKLIDFVDDLVQQQVITGDVFEEIYKFIPTLSSVAMIGGDKDKASDKVVYYQELYPERFAELTSEDGTIKPDKKDEEGNITEKGTFTLFFEENPITFANDEEIAKEAEKLVDVILVDNICQLLPLIPAFVAPEATPLFSGIDKVCKALGIEQDGELLTIVLGGDHNLTRGYVKNILKALLPNVVSSVLDILRNVVDKEDMGLLYTGVSEVFFGLEKVVNAPLVSMILPADVAEQIKPVIEGFKTLPTLEEPKRFDLEKIAVQAFDAYANADFDLVFVDDVTKATDGKNFYLGRLEPVLADLGNAKTNAEAVVILYNYIYDNVLQVPGNITLILDLVNVELPLDPAMFASMSKDEVFALIYSIATGEDIMPEEPTEPTAPTEPADPSEPVTDDPAEPVTPPANGDSAVIGIFAAMAVLSGAALVITKKRS